MELLKNLFSEGEALTYDQLTEKIGAAGLKLANIADGSYVSRDKMDSKVKGLQGQITDLQAQVKQRDTDMADLQTKLTAAQTDADKLASVPSDLAALRRKSPRRRMNVLSAKRRARSNSALTLRKSSLLRMPSPSSLSRTRTARCRAMTSF